MTEVTSRRLSIGLSLLAALPLALLIFNQTGPSLPTSRDWLAIPSQAPGAPTQFALCVLGWVVAAAILVRQARRGSPKVALVVLAPSLALGALAFALAYGAAASMHATDFGGTEIGARAPLVYGLFSGVMVSSLIALIGCAVSESVTRRD